MPKFDEEERKFEMKEYGIHALIAVLIGLVLFLGGLARKNAGIAQDLQLKLAEEKAKAVTGACGTEFAVSGLGKNKDKAAVAGRIVYVNWLGNYYQTEETVKREDTPLDRKMVAVYFRNPDTSRQELLFRRPR